jgi:hypothetical protein
MKAKVSLLVAALGKPDPTQLHHNREDPMGELHSSETNVPTARRLDTGKMNAPTTREQHWSPKKLLQERRQDGSLNQSLNQDLIGLAGIGSD